MRSTQSRTSPGADRPNSTSLRSHQPYNTAHRPSMSTASTAYSSQSRGSRMRGVAGSTRAKDEAHRRAQDLRQEIEAAVHVLDNGVNRTPMPLQQRQSLMGVRGAAGGAGPDMGSSLLHSSFLMSCDAQSGGRSPAGGGAGGLGGLSSYLQSSTSTGRRGGNRKASEVSMESSMRSLSMAGDSTSQSQIGFRPRGASSDSSAYTSSQQQQLALRRHSAGGADLSALAGEPQGLLDGAVYVRRKPMSDHERRAWMRTRTTIKLTETPTVFLYEHQDEAVSHEQEQIVEEVKERNELYAEVVEAHRVDEGTRYQERGTATFAVAKKSTHCEVHPPEKVDAGALQVTPWMLKDAFAPLLDDADDDADDRDDEKRNAGGDGADGTGGEDGDEDDGNGDAGLENDMEGSSAQNDGSTSGKQESASAEQSGRPSTRDTCSGGAGGSGGGVSPWMLADSLMSNLRVMERALVQNIMEKAQLAYRGVPTPAEAARLGLVQEPAVTSKQSRKALPGAVAPTATGTQDSEAAKESGNGAVVGADGATASAADATVTGAVAVAGSDLPEMSSSDGIRALWRYHSHLTEGRSVTCMAWNRRETDILAVGYGPRRVAVAQDGQAVDLGAAPLGEDNATKDGKSGGTAAKAVSSSVGKDTSTNLTEGRAGKDLSSQRGLICCWSLKNPLAPELVLHLPADAGVSALAFSFEQPSLLAVGNSAGGLVVYDIQRDLATPSIVPAVSAGLHTGAVWALKWVTTGKERGEFLMSISADGRVVQWVVGKTIEKVAPDLMHLKRQPGTQVESAFVEGVAAAEEAAASAAAAAAGRRGAKGASKKNVGTAAGTGGSAAPTTSKEDAVLSRQSGGMCFDVCPTDHAIYLVGTEDGSVYQCNRSQTETYDLDYAPHTELVYRIRWSPYSSKYFLTCSADWTTRLYALGNPQMLLQYDTPNQDAVQDVAWSYSNALYFATATAQGNVELWSVADPIYPRATVRYADHRRLNCLLFAEQDTPVVVVGDDEGDVTVFLLKDSVYGRQDLTDDEQEVWLEDAVKKGR